MPQEDRDHRPPPPSWLDKELIQKALRAGDEDPTISVSSCDITMANALGDGYMGDMYRVVAKLQDSQDRRVIVKCHPQGGIREEFAKKVGMFQKETTMLSDTLPAMYNLLDKARPGQYQPFSAKCLYHGKDPFPFLILEDLRQSGFTLINRQQGMDMPHSTLLVKTLGRLHAASIAHFEKDPSALQYYQKSFFSEDIREDMTSNYVSALQTLEKTVMKWSGYEKYSEKIKTVRENVYDLVMKLVESRDGELTTLIHGDCWPGNMMFRYSDTCVTDMRLVDYQTSFYTSPTIDLHHFLGVCQNVDVCNSTDNLLREYHTSLTEALDILHCPAYKISFEELKKAFEERALYGFLVTVSILPFYMTDPSNGLDMNDVFGQSDMMTSSIESAMGTVVYERIMKKLLVRCENLGVL